ncbi:MAG: DUF6702 family protein [Gemmatimonadales bacterium]
MLGLFISSAYALALAWAGATVSAVHPMHTAVTEITYDRPSRMAAISIRVFADDFGTAVATQGDAATRDSAQSLYVRSAFVLTGRSGQTLPIHWEGSERQGDVVLLRLRADVPDGLSGVKVLSALLCERFDDQINVVRASYEGRAATLLFTRGERAKALP